MIRAGITNWLAILGAACAACLPIATGVSEPLPRPASAIGGYPVRIALPPPASPTTLAAAPSAAPPQEAGDGPAPELSGSPVAPPADETSLAATSAEPQPAVSKARSNGLLKLSFDLGDPSTAFSDDSASADVEVAKKVRVNGTDVGQAKIRVTSGATLLVARDQMVSLLEAAGHSEMAKILTASPSSDRFITFEEIRRRGISVQYDAAADRIALSS